MKPSRYAYVCQADDNQHLLFQSSTGAFASLDDAAYRLWQSLCDRVPDDEGETSHQSADLEGQREAWTNQLKDAGFLVDDPKDELLLQSAWFRTDQQDRSTLSLCLAPTYACNLRCPYCYEKEHTDSWAMMDGEVIQAIYDFVKEVYQRDGFKTLDIQWYGGDPSLALDVVEKMSEHFIQWCAAHQVTYTATMLSNCAKIGHDEARLLDRCQVRQVMITIDGPDVLHNRRRPAADGTDSYEALLEAVRALQAQQIDILAFMNVDKINAEVFEQMRDQLEADMGIHLNPTKLNDYHGTYGCAPFASPDFNLFTFPEYARWDLERFAKTSPSAQDIGRNLASFGTFCRGQKENYYCIDALGDVYKCDGRMGQPEYVLFNLLHDAVDVGTLDTVTKDPADDPQCGECHLLPVCRGNCYWERECCGMPCHPLKYTMDDYLRLYRSRFDEPTAGLTLLVDPAQVQTA